MNKKELQNDVIKMIEGMEGNKFLLPDSWSPEIQMASQDILYKTYVGSRGSNRYMNIHTVRGEREVDIHISDNVITAQSSVFGKPITAQEVHDLVSAVYEEKHSFIESAGELVKMRTEIAKKRAEIRNANEELKKLEIVLQDFLKLSKLNKPLGGE
jgi:hypothetical protein